MASYDKQEWRKGPWTPREDKLLLQYISQNGEGRWSSVSKCTGLNRSRKSCRLRWVNYLRPGLKKGHLTPQEEAIIIELHALWGNKWSTIARYLPGRTDNGIKNYWRTHFKKTEKKQVKRQILKKQQQLESDISNNIINDQSVEAADDHEKKEAAIAFSSTDNHQFLPVLDQETTISEFIPSDCCLWGGLWNLDDQNQASTVVSYWDFFEGDPVDYVQSGGSFMF